MKALLAALVLVGLLAMPGALAGAEDPTPDEYPTTFAQILGIIGGGSATWIVSYPTNVPTTGTYHVAITVSTTTAATANLTLTTGTFQGSGCTIGTLVVDPSTTSQVTAYIPVTVTGPYCFGSARITLAVGTNTITAIRASFQIAADTVTVTDDADGWALTGIPSTLTVNDGDGWVVDIADDTTNDGQLTVPASSVVGNASLLFPAELDVNNHFPGTAASPGFDFWALVVFWIVLLAFFLWQKWWLSAAFAIPGLLDGLFPTQIPDDLSLYLVLCLLGVCMEVAAHKFDWGYWKNRRPSGA